MTQEFSNKKTVDVGKVVGLDARGAVVGPMPGPLDWTGGPLPWAAGSVDCQAP